MAPMGAQVIGRGSAAGVVSPEESVAQVAAAVKEMKAPAAAEVVADWSDDLATEVLAILPARAAGAIAAALPAELAARLLARLSLLPLTEEP